MALVHGRVAGQYTCCNPRPSPQSARLGASGLLPQQLAGTGGLAALAALWRCSLPAARLQLHSPRRLGRRGSCSGSAPGRSAGGRSRPWRMSAGWWRTLQTRGQGELGSKGGGLAALNAQRAQQGGCTRTGGMVGDPGELASQKRYTESLECCKAGSASCLRPSPRHQGWRQSMQTERAISPARTWIT
jgi:hypothetical protein